MAGKTKGECGGMFKKGITPITPPSKQTPNKTKKDKKGKAK